MGGGSRWGLETLLEIERPAPKAREEHCWALQCQTLKEQLSFHRWDGSVPEKGSACPWIPQPVPSYMEAEIHFPESPESFAP